MISVRYIDATELANRYYGATLDLVKVKASYDGVEIPFESDGVEVLVRLSWDHVEHGADLSVTVPRSGDVLSTGSVERFVEENNL